MYKKKENIVLIVNNLLKFIEILIKLNCNILKIVKKLKNFYFDMCMRLEFVIFINIK